MNESFYEAIERATSPRALKAALITALRELDNQASRDPWDDEESWSGPPMSMAEMVVAQRQANAATAQLIEAKQRFASDSEARAARFQRRLAADPRLARRIELVQEQLDLATDPEEAAALTARLRLLREEGDEPERIVEEGQRVHIDSDGTLGVVEIPETSIEVKAQRYAWAKARNLHDFVPSLGTEDQAAEAYAKGGPMWLYLHEAGRDALLAMPAEWRRELVQQIAAESPAQAHEVGADLLKQEDALDLRTSSAQRALGAAEEAFSG